MSASVNPSERFVDIPGIMEITFKSDDPEFYKAPIDLFDEQANGLPNFSYLPQVQENYTTGLYNLQPV